MQFGFDKCAVLKMKSGNQVHCDGIDLEGGVVTEEADEERYKYPGILQRGDIWNKGELDKIDRETKNCKICMEVYTDALPLTGCTYEELREVEGF